MTGTTIKHYEIRDKLGGGGMGAVCRARDTRLDRPVAFKVWWQRSGNPASSTCVRTSCLTDSVPRAGRIPRVLFEHPGAPQNPAKRIVRLVAGVLIDLVV